MLAQLYGFRMLQPPWMPYALYRWISESRATRFLETSLKRDFPEAHLRMKGISDQSQISMGLLYLLHALEPMLSDVSRCAIVPAFAACSAVAVRGGRSATGEPVIARNFDYLPLVQPLYTLRESRPRSGFRSLDFGSACHLCDSQETVIRALNCISCGSMLAYEVKHMRETIEKFALGIVFTSASASSIEWLIEHIDQRPAEVDDMASMRCAQMPMGLHGFSVDPLSLFRRCTVKDNAMFCWVLRRYR